MKTDKFQDKVIFISGAASGFGKLLAEKLSDTGAKLVLGDRDINGLTQVVEALRSKGTEVISQYCDVTQESEVAALIDAAVKAFGRLDIAINNAGICSASKSLIDTEEKDLDVNFAVNAKGVFFGVKHQIRQMLTQGEGAILNVASMAGIGGAPKLTAYCAAKHAVVGITKTAAVEYGRKNIRVNAICPFYSPTPMVTETDINHQQDFLAQGSPMKRLGDPAEIVDAMLLIIAPENSYMNGQAIAVDGGISAF